MDAMGVCFPPSLSTGHTDWPEAGRSGTHPFRHRLSGAHGGTDAVHRHHIEYLPVARDDEKAQGIPSV